MLSPVLKLIFNYGCQFPPCPVSRPSRTQRESLLFLLASWTLVHLPFTAFHYGMFFPALQSASDCLTDLGKLKLVLMVALVRMSHCYYPQRQQGEVRQSLEHPGLNYLLFCPCCRWPKFGHGILSEGRAQSVCLLT